jgi:hypothetical protein
MDLPKNIRILAIDFKTKEIARLTNEENSEKFQGMILYRDSVIAVEKKLEEQQKFQTLWHEILHGLNTQMGFERLPEETIDALAYGIVAVLRDNKYLRGSWLWQR